MKTTVVERQVNLDGSISETRIPVRSPEPGKGACAPASGCERLDWGHNGSSEHVAITRLTGVTAKIYYNEVEICYPKNPAQKSRSVPERKAGDIKQFSRKSRMRLLRMYNRIQHICLSNPIFVTLTARPECFEQKAEIVPGEYSQQVHNYLFRKFFIPALKKIIPECAYVWKMEPHKSGQAHYHLMIWSKKPEFKIDSEYYKRQIRACWRSIIDDDSRSAELFACKILSIKDERAVFSYMSKYVMKEEDSSTAKIEGRRWGRSSNLPISPITEIPLSMSQYERLRDFCAELMKRRKVNNEYILDKMYGGGDWFIWLDSETITEVLRKNSRFAEASKYQRFLKTGSVDPGIDELEAIAAEFRIDF